MLPPYGLVARGFGFALALLAAPFVSAQSQGLVVRDGSLGSGPLEVGPGSDPLGRPATYLITPELGEQRGSNLFHSFARFGVGSGETATFTGPDPIDGPQSVSHVIGRVTGGTPSDIDGTLRSTIPGADLWLFNPSGVIFGEGAQLDVRGSVHVSTGDHVGFAETGERFHADRSRPSVLSTAPPEAFGFLGESGAAALSLDPGASLAVGAGEALELVAGDISLTDARIAAPGAHLRLEAQGTVSLERSTVDVSGSEAGTVSIRAGRLVVQGGPDVLDDTQRSRVLAQNSSTVPREPGVLGPGSISVDASESILVDNGLLSVNTLGAGNAGMVRLKSPSVTVQRGPGYDAAVWTPRATDVGVGAQTVGTGAAGKIHIEATDLVVSNGAAVSAGAVGTREGVVRGKAGTVEIAAHSVEVSQRSAIEAAAWGAITEAGSIRVDLGDDGTLLIDGKGQAGGDSAYAFMITTAYGTPGLIEVEAGTLDFRDGGGLISECDVRCTSKRDTRTENQGAIRVAADEVILKGGYISAKSWGLGDASDVTIHAGSLTMREGGAISAQTFGPGDGGVIKIEAKSVAVGARSSVRAGTSGEGDGGSIIVRAGQVQVGPGESAQFGVTSLRFFDTPPDLVLGAAGTIDIQATDWILLTNAGAKHRSLLEVVGQSVVTGILSGTFEGGYGGSIQLTAPVITVRDGAIVATSTVGGGDSGTALLSGGRILVLNGGSVASASLANPFTQHPGGNAGDVTLDASQAIEVSGYNPEFGASRVVSINTGPAAAGAVTLRAPRVLIDARGTVMATALPIDPLRQGIAGGRIRLEGDDLLVTRGARVDASTFVAGAGGGIEVVARKSLVVDGPGSGISSRTGGAGLAGSISLRSPFIRVSDGGEVAAHSAPGLEAVNALVARSLFEYVGRSPVATSLADVRGDAGSIELVSDALDLIGGRIATNAENADGGEITIAARDRVHLIDGMITAAVNDGNGGNIAIDPVLVMLEGGSHIDASAGTGSGGRIGITAQNLFVLPGSSITASAGDAGIDGTVEIHSPDVNLAGTLTALPISLLDAPSLLRERCAARTNGERAGSFVVRGPGGIPAEPDGWLRAPLPMEAAGTTGPLARLASPGPFLAPSSCR